jgi:hypothetical protein
MCQSGSGPEVCRDSEDCHCGRGPAVVVIRIRVPNDATNYIDFDDFAVSFQFRPSADRAGFEAELVDLYDRDLGSCALKEEEINA